MTLSDYLSDKRAVLLTCLAGGLFFSVLLYLYGIAPQEMFLLWICYAGIVSGSLCRGYVILKKRLLYLQSLLDSWIGNTSWRRLPKSRYHPQKKYISK